MGEFAALVQEWEEAAHGAKGAVLAPRLLRLGISLGTFHRQRHRLFEGPRRKPPKTKGQRKRPEFAEAVRLIMREKYHPHAAVEAITTAKAQELAARKGCALALAIPEGTVNRVARELGLHPRVQRREVRFQASRPNELHQLDATRSRYFQCHQRRDGEWVIKLSPRIFRNRDYREHRERVWLWGLVDDYSGLRVARYCVAKGESHRHGIDFLQWAWSQHEAHAPFRGLPDSLYTDQGALAKKSAFRFFCQEAAQVRLIAHEANRPQATGKVESGWREIKHNFEAVLIREYPDWLRREFTLEEINQRLCRFLREECNSGLHRSLPMSKEAAWLSIRRPVELEPGAWAHVFHRERRTLDAAGCFDFRGETYEVDREMPYPGGVRAEVYLGVRDGAVLVADPRDGCKYAAAPFEPRPAGEYGRGERTPLEKLLDDAGRQSAAHPARSQITFAPEAESNVIPLVRRAEVRESGFQMPEAPRQDAGATGKTLEELAAGVTIIDRSIDRSIEPERLFATPLERYEAIVAAQATGQTMSPGDRDFLAWFRGEYGEMLSLLAEPRLRIVSSEQ